MTIYRNHTLQSNFEYDGTWWLPQDPDYQLPGTLTFSPENGTRLDLIGSFRQAPIANLLFRTDFIVGITDSQIECTLIDAQQTGRKNLFGPSKQTFIANRLLMGGIFSDQEELTFNWCQISYDHIEEWVGLDPFKNEMLYEGDKPIGYNVQIETREAFRASLPLTEIEISLSNRICVRDQNQTRMVLSNEAFIKMAPSAPNGLDDFLRWIHDLGRLIGLLMGDITWPRKVHLTYVVKDSETDKEVASTACLFFRPVLGSNRRRPFRYEMPVQFERFVSKLPTNVDHWLNHDPGFQPVKDLFFYTLYADGNNTTNKLLNLSHGLEAYHRYKMGGEYVDQDVYDNYYSEIVSNLPSGVPTGLKDALKAKLKYGNQFSLRKRLTKLLKSIDPKLLKLVTSKEKPFITTAIATRNYHVHYDKDDEALAAKGADILYLNQRLELLLRILFMRELGFDDLEIHEMLEDKTHLLPWNRGDEKYPG